MPDISRDSFTATQNSLNDIRGRAGGPQPAPRHYVSLRLQQGVPVLDADWNEVEDIRRLELEAILAGAIGSGVPAGGDGFRIRESGQPGDFLIERGLLFLDGWMVFLPATVRYALQPHRNASGLAPALPVPLPPAAAAHRELVFLDAWERTVDSVEDDRMVDARIGVETCVRVERAWVVRCATIAPGADPRAPGTVPDRQPGHRYYALATVDRMVGSAIGDGQIGDVRRTHLTLEALTHQPLLVDDPIRGQRLDSPRLRGAFRANLDALRDTLQARPEVFVYPTRPVETWQAMTALHDVRSAATAFEQQAQARALHRQAAQDAAQSFFDVQSRLAQTLAAFVAGGAAGAPTNDFVGLYRTHLLGTLGGDPQPMQAALAAGDVLGAVMAQERLNEALALQSNGLPEGAVTASLVAVAPVGNVVAGTNYQLTVRVRNQLVSTQGNEDLRLAATAGLGWTVRFQGSVQPDLREHVLENVPNGTDAEAVLVITADAGAANASLGLTVRPERRQQLVFTHPPRPLAIGQPILPATLNATLAYEGPALPPSIARATMFAGLSLPFRATNLAATPQTYQVTVTAQGASTNWQAPAQPVLPVLAPGANTAFNVLFKTSNQAGAVSPVTWRLQLVRVTGGVNEPQANTIVDLTFVLS